MDSRQTRAPGLTNVGLFFGMTREDELEVGHKGGSVALAAAVAAAIALGLFMGWLIWSAFLR